MYILQFKIVPKDKEVLLRHEFWQSFGSIKFTKENVFLQIILSEAMQLNLLKLNF